MVAHRMLTTTRVEGREGGYGHQKAVSVSISDADFGTLHAKFEH